VSFQIAREREGEPQSSRALRLKEGVRGVSARPVEGEVLLLGEHPLIKAVLAKIEIVAKSAVPVFIVGESGTGKEIVARLIHARSDRMDRDLVTLNCAALPRDVIENELFGHEREAFTGAVTNRRGLFELANGSTLFLDEIGEMHHQVQAKLLRAIENQAFRRLGGHENVRVDVRVVAATNRDIATSLASGSLREDLYYRLSVVELVLPPLRKRKTDIPLLVDHFLGHFCATYGKQPMRLTQESMAIIEAYDWPGNVRELRNVVESIVLLSPSAVIEASSLPFRVSGVSSPPQEFTLPFGTSLAEAERTIILRTLEMTGDNKSEAARILGVSRKSLYDKLGRYARQRTGGRPE
jgi:DNA-binding NtrC family response regulator